MRVVQRFSLLLLLVGCPAPPSAQMSSSHQPAEEPSAPKIELPEKSKLTPSTLTPDTATAVENPATLSEKRPTRADASFRWVTYEIPADSAGARYPIDPGWVTFICLKFWKTGGAPDERRWTNGSCGTSNIVSGISMDQNTLYIGHRLTFPIRVSIAYPPGTTPLIEPE